MKWNRRTRTILLVTIMAVLLLTIAMAGILMPSEAYAPDYNAKKLIPSAAHLFGTDFLGRDMFARMIKGLSNSIIIGGIAALASALISLVLGLLSATFGGVVDKVISYFVDMVMGMPQLIMIMMISFMLGRGIKGVIIGVALTHWPSLTRVIRAEVLQIKERQFVKSARGFGVSPMKIAFNHIIPHVVSQLLIGLVLMFPHAILHEASITFLGFGLSVDTPAIGIILSEALKHISTGMWWLMVFPGITLLIVVMAFDKLGDCIKLLIDPSSAHE